MENDENTVEEETTPEPSTENKAADSLEDTSEDETMETEPTETEVEEKKVPYDRFKNVVDERNKYKELLQSQSDSLGTTKGSLKATEQIVREVETQTGESYEEALDLVKKIAAEAVSKEVGQLQRQMELDKAASAHPDFYQFTDQIKDKITSNPHLGWEDAYKLVKFDISQSQSFEAGKKQAYGKIQEKKGASTESARKQKSNQSSVALDEINSLAKGPDGKYLYSVKEIEEILPKEQTNE